MGPDEAVASALVIVERNASHRRRSAWKAMDLFVEIRSTEEPKGARTTSAWSYLRCYRSGRQVLSEGLTHPGCCCARIGVRLGIHLAPMSTFRSPWIVTEHRRLIVVADSRSYLLSTLASSFFVIASWDIVPKRR